MSKLSFVVGVGVGYVLGTRAGREQYERIVAQGRAFLGSPTVRQVTDAAKAEAARVVDEGTALLRSKTEQVSQRLDSAASKAERAVE